jgi:hypothetical protein
MEFAGSGFLRFLFVSMDPECSTVGERIPRTSYGAVDGV